MPTGALPRLAAGEEESLLAAMLETAAAEGYAGASVARVLARAGVSRRAFYRRFAGREDCFLAAYRAAAAAIGARLARAVRESAPCRRPQATVAALLAAVAEEPAVARAVFLEVLAAGAEIRAEHERLLDGVERSIDRFLARAEAPALLVPSRALLGGVWAVLTARLLSGRPAAGEEAAELAAWVRTYECRGGSTAPAWLSAAPGPVPRRGGIRGGAAAVDLLPRGRSALPPAAAASSRRERILMATIRQSAARGYAQLTVADVVADARVPRAAFYSHFACKQEAFLAAQTFVLRESIASVAAEFATGETWPERVWRGLQALLAYVASHPDAASLRFVEVHAAGGAALQRSRANRAAYTLFLADGYRQPRPGAHLPPLSSEAVAGAIEAIVRGYVARGETERAGEALPRCAYVALAPFIGPEAAMEWVGGRLREGG